MIDLLGRTYIKHLETPNIDKGIEVQQVEHESSWTDPIFKYLIDEVLPSDPIEARRINWMASQYLLLDETLYKRSFTLPLLKSLGSIDADYALREVDEGIYEDHLGGRSLTYKILK